jgi:hypothetical protein
MDDPKAARSLDDLSHYATELAKVHPEMSAREIAERVARKASRPFLVELAIRQIADDVDMERRAMAREVETRAARLAEAEKLENGREAQERRNAETWAWKQERDKYREGRKADSLRALLSEYKAMVRLELTEELLASPFALGDGTSVTWGEATKEQHEIRIALLTKSAVGTLETAARHGAAIRMIEEKSATCLADIREAA